MTRQSDTDWIREGARVAVVSNGPHGMSVHADVITSVTQRHVVTSKNGKFQLDGLRPVGRGGYNPTDVQMLPPSDPRVADALACIRTRNLGGTVRKLTDGFTGDVAGALAVLAEIEKAVASTHEAIEGYARRVAEGSE